MVSLAALGLGQVGNSVMEEGIAIGRIYRAAIVYLPALFVMIGLAVFLLDFAPKLTGMTWFYLTYSFFVLYLGGMLPFPEWMGTL